MSTAATKATAPANVSEEERPVSRLPAL